MVPDGLIPEAQVTVPEKPAASSLRIKSSTAWTAQWLTCSGSPFICRQSQTDAAFPGVHGKTQEQAPPNERGPLPVTIPLGPERGILRQWVSLTWRAQGQPSRQKRFRRTAPCLGSATNS